MMKRSWCSIIIIIIIIIIILLECMWVHDVGQFL